MNDTVLSRSVHKNIRLGERYTEILHASGLRIFVYPKKCSSVYAILQVGLGSMDSEYLDATGNACTMPHGTAHYLEHKMFENADGINSDMRFSALGAECNAFTSYDRTAYLFNTTSNVNACLAELLRFVTHPYFTEESVERERGIIAEEIRGAADHPWERAYAQMIKAMYEQHTVRYEIAGSERSIAAVTPALLYSCTDTFYVPSNMSLAICGDVTPAQVLRIVNEQIPSDYVAPRFSHKRFDEKPFVQSTRAVSYMSRPYFIACEGGSDLTPPLSVKKIPFGDSKLFPKALRGSQLGKAELANSPLANMPGERECRFATSPNWRLRQFFSRKHPMARPLNPSFLPAEA